MTSVTKIDGKSERTGELTDEILINDLKAAVEALALFFGPDDVFEIRAPAGKNTWSGYLDLKHKKAVREAIEMIGDDAAGIYFTINPVIPALRARAANRMERFAKHTTKDKEITRRVRLFVDFDPVRPPGISSTEIEHQMAIERALAVRDDLLQRGWPRGLLIDSGNGAHLYHWIDIPVGEAGDQLVKNCLQALQAEYGDEHVIIDTTTGNAARIAKLPGTIARKGDNTPDRPHRLCSILRQPKKIVPVALELLEQLAAQAPSKQKTTSPVDSAESSNHNLEQFVAHSGLEVSEPEPYQGGRKWKVNCPFDPEHGDKAAVFESADGTPGYDCFKPECSNNHWPEFRAWVEETTGVKYRWRTADGTSEADISHHANWPEPPRPEAFQGVAGELVRMIEPHSEADPAALLVQFLVAFGNLIGRYPHFVAEADRHFMNLFAVVVGLTAKGRKGSSLGQILAILLAVDAGWSDARIMSGLSSGEGLIWAVRDEVKGRSPIRENGHIAGYEDVITDPGVADKRLLVVEPEFARVLKVAERESNTLSAILRQGWDSGSLRIMTKNQAACATGAHISVIAHITKNEVKRLLTDTAASNGFGNRFLWVCARRSKLLPDGGALNAVDFNSVIERVRDAVDFARSMGEMQRTKQARELWYSIYEPLSDGKPGLFGSVTSRAETQTMRLACLFALLDQSECIRTEHLKAGLAVWRYCEDSARFIFGDALGDGTADEILGQLRQRPGEGMTRNDIREHFNRNKPSAEIGRALASLQELGLARVELEHENGIAGRPTERWFEVTLSREKRH